MAQVLIGFRLYRKLVDDYCFIESTTPAMSLIEIMAQNPGLKKVFMDSLTGEITIE